eukprot:c16354_g1_i1.p1 GENE.c16354_g1_i1~~c16354_g1_i1.p1  ORF type:complete len:301 (+),score=96.97 c16354_g1_i1:286-1188(+)
MFQNTVDANILILKISAILLLWITSCLGSFAALKFRKKQFYLPYCNSFIVGALLGNCLLHIFPEIDIELVNKYDFPLTYFVSGIGGLILYIIPKSPINPSRRYLTRSFGSLFRKRVQLRQQLHRFSYSKTPTEDQESFEEEGFEEEKNIYFTFLHICLFFQSFTEGLILQKQATPSSTIGNVSIVILHKFLNSFALTITTITSQYTWNHTIILLSFYSISTPIGMLFGYIFNELYSSIIIFMISAICGGIVLHVALVHMLTQELYFPNCFSKLCLTTLGFIAMIILSAFDRLEVIGKQQN